MKVDLTVRDFLSRACHVYPDRVGSVDEPDQPAEPWPDLTYGEIAARARAQAAGLDRLGVGPGRAGGHGLAELGPPAHVVLRGGGGRSGLRTRSTSA